MVCISDHTFFRDVVLSGSCGEFWRGKIGIRQLLGEARRVNIWKGVFVGRRDRGRCLVLGGSCRGAPSHRETHETNDGLTRHRVFGLEIPRKTHRSGVPHITGGVGTCIGKGVPE